MIDVESMVFDSVYNAISTSAYSNTEMTSDYDTIPSSFPCVAIYETDNQTYQKTQDDVLKEHHARVIYEVNVYSNKPGTKKSEAKAIMDIVDNTLQEIKFTRTFRNVVPNADKTIYRIVARYEAVIAEKNGDIYQVYRK